MKVLFCASECVPFVKTGGLADVVGSLPKELLKQGCDVRVVIPKYRVIDWSYIVSMEHICHFSSSYILKLAKKAVYIILTLSIIIAKTPNVNKNLFIFTKSYAITCNNKFFVGWNSENSYS